MPKQRKIEIIWRPAKAEYIKAGLWILDNIGTSAGIKISYEFEKKLKDTS